MRIYRPADIVALILACGVVAIGSLIGLALVVNVVRGHNPSPTLGENTTQVLIGLLGGMIGILGIYLGYSVFIDQNGNKKRPHSEE